MMRFCFFLQKYAMTDTAPPAVGLDLPSLDLHCARLGQLPQYAQSDDDCLLRILPSADYQDTHRAMLERTLAKIDAKEQGAPLADELWLVEHSDVYTLGQAGKSEHILQKTQTPVVQTDRGGQITWHGTGQLVLYFLFDLQKLSFGVRDLVSHSEQATEDVLNRHLGDGLCAKARRDAPGVYIYNAKGDMQGKIASLGFKIKRGHSYHGVAINLSNDLRAFDFINPCGYAGMPMARLGDLSAVSTRRFILDLLDNIHQRRQGAVALRPIDA